MNYGKPQDLMILEKLATYLINILIHMHDIELLNIKNPICTSLWEMF